MQTVKGSLAEAWANIAVGFTINYTANLLILPLFGFANLSAGKNFAIGIIYTVISLVRSFVIRRYFNGLKFGNTEAQIVSGRGRGAVEEATAGLEEACLRAKSSGGVTYE